MSSDENIKVGVRVRPLSSKELGEGDIECLSAIDTTIKCGSDHKFTYDYAFEPSTTNEELYGHAARPLLDDVFRGFNATIMAYGQTGSGKTFTMGTDAEAASSSGDTLGVLPRFVNDMFQRIATDKTRVVTTSVSLLEIYNDQMRDLLVDKSLDDIPELKLDTGKKGLVHVHGLIRREVSSTADVLRILGDGLSERVVGATNMNAVSSRSHAIFEIAFESKPADEASEEDAGPAFSSKITFVDLAGSERLKRTGAEGGRKDEGIAINKSLLVLGTVINSLCKGLAHIPYRECKLTRLLQNALGGNSRTLFLACVSPASNNFAESLNSLRYANRAREIKNAAIVNMDEHSRLVMHFKQREEVLKDQLIRERYFGGRTIAANDPEFVERKMRPSTSDYLNQIFADANIDAKASFKKSKRSDSAVTASSSQLSQSVSTTASLASISEAMGPPKKTDSEAYKGKIDVDADLKVLPIPENIADDRRSSSSSVDSTDELEAETTVLHTENDLEVAATKCDQEMAEKDNEIDEVSDDLEVKVEVLAKMQEKMKNYAERYNRLRDEFDQLRTTASSNDREKHRLEQQIAKAKQRNRARALSKTDPNIAAMKVKLAALNNTVKATKSLMVSKQREINALKRESDLADRLKEEVRKLKARKAKLERDRKDSEVRHTQLLAAKKREIGAAKKKLNKITLAKRKSDNKIQQQVSTLSRTQHHNQKLKNDLAALKKQLNSLAASKMTRHRKNRKRDIGGEGCHKEGSAMQNDLLKYVRARVRLSQKAVKLQSLGAQYKEVGDELKAARAAGNIDEIDVATEKLQHFHDQIEIGYQELNVLATRCDKDWPLLQKLDRIQRGTVVSYLIEQITSAKDDLLLARQDSERLQEHKSRLQETVKKLRSRIVRMTTQQRTAAKRAAVLNESSFEGSPRKRLRAKSGQDKENSMSSGLGKIETVDEEFGDDEFCSGNAALAMIDATSDVAPSTTLSQDEESRFKRALRAERALKKAAKDELEAKEARRRLTLSGMRAGGLSDRERRKQGNDNLRRGNARARSDARRMTMGGRMNRPTSSIFKPDRRRSSVRANKRRASGAVK